MRPSLEGPSSGTGLALRRFRTWRLQVGRAGRRRLRLLRRVRVRLAVRAVPGATAADARLLDRRPAARARLALTAVHPELVLHRARVAVRLRVVAERRALPRDPGLQRAPDPAMERLELRRRQLARRP